MCDWTFIQYDSGIRVFALAEEISLVVTYCLALFLLFVCFVANYVCPLRFLC